jgi:hypothetical protein
MIFCIILLAAASTISCATQNEPKAPTPPTNTPTPTEPAKPTEPTTPNVVDKRDIKTFIPLEVGNIWQYEGEGNEYASYTQEVEFQKDNRFQLSTDTGGTVMANIFELREDSIVNVFRKGEEYDHKNLLNQTNNLEVTLLKLPIAVGTKWISEENTYEIIDTNAKLTVPFGTFENCVVVKLIFKDGSEQYMTYKDGVGMLQSEFRTGDSSIFSRLKSFMNKKK